MQILNGKAFTLVELIVVITIVGILSTVGFVSYSNYLTGARDSNRVSQMVKLSDSLQVYSATKTAPLPDNYIQITASGAANIIGYQGYIGVDVLETIDYTNGGVDPKDKGYFTYYLTKDRNGMQLLALMEESGTLGFAPKFGQANAGVYPNRFPKVYGRKLGVLTQVDTNTPAQEVTGITTVDIVSTTNQYIAHISDDEKVKGSGTQLRVTIPNANCKRLRQTGVGSENGIYTINPNGAGEVQAYCDMETAGGGWTLIARGLVGGTGTFNLANNLGSVNNLTVPYSLSITNLKYTQSMLAAYSGERNIDTSKVINNAGTASLTLTPHVMTTSTITGGVAADGFLGKTGMLFVK